MSSTQSALFQSLHEMKDSYTADLQMLTNYCQAVQSDLPLSGTEHLRLLQDQLRLIIDNIDEFMKLR